MQRLLILPLHFGWRLPRYIATTSRLAKGSKWLLHGIKASGFCALALGVAGLFLVMTLRTGKAGPVELALALFCAAYLDIEGVLFQAMAPPSVLILTHSNTRTAQLQVGLNVWLIGSRAVSLLHPSSDAGMTQQFWVRVHSFRTVNEERWREAVRELAHMALLIVVDHRSSSASLKEELLILDKCGFLRKTLLLHGGRGKVAKETDDGPLVFFSEAALVRAILRVMRVPHIAFSAAARERALAAAPKR